MKTPTQPSLSAAQQQIRAGQRGMSLVELMVVIVVVGILSGLAVVMLRGRPSLEETANQLANQIREASRKAIAGGIVDQTQVSGSIPTAARARLSIVYDAGLNKQITTVELRDETLADSPAEAEWQVVSTHYLRDDVVVYGYSPHLIISESGYGDAYGSGTGAGLGSETQIKGPHDTGPATTVIDLYFNPDGSVSDVAGQPLTLFLLQQSGSKMRRMRVVTMPLQGQPLVFTAW